MQEFYFGYKDFPNPNWFKRMVTNHYKIKRYEYELNNTWYGLFNRERLKRIIDKLKARNRKILLKHTKATSARFNYWTDGRGQKVAVLEVWTD